MVSAWIRSQSWTPLVPGNEGWAEVSGFESWRRVSPALCSSQGRVRSCCFCLLCTSLPLQELLGDLLGEAVGGVVITSSSQYFVALDWAQGLGYSTGNNKPLWYQVVLLLRHLRASGWWEDAPAWVAQKGLLGNDSRSCTAELELLELFSWLKGRQKTKGNPGANVCCQDWASSVHSSPWTVKTEQGPSGATLLAPVLNLVPCHSASVGFSDLPRRTCTAAGQCAADKSEPALRMQLKA